MTGVPYLVAGAVAFTIQFDLDFQSKILANLTTNWKPRGPIKQDNEIIDTEINS